LQLFAVQVMDLTHCNSAFPSTQWTEVVRICQGEDSSSRHVALAALCKDYWYPLYAFARRMGRSSQDAEDLTQGFFCYALERNVISTADPELGKLRTFLLRIFQRYIGDIDDRERALKRGGGKEMLSLDLENGEERYLREPADKDTPETLFQRTWALSVLRGALKVLEIAEQKAGNEKQFKTLEPFLDPDTAAEGCYADAATSLGMTVDTVRQMVSRLRKKFRECLREQIAATLHDPTNSRIDHELTALRAALRS
jgi:RNA polymerase sigma-70 factor (ECF subfamily)